MNANESISLAKMAVSVLLLCLMLSGVLLLWYFLYGAQNQQINRWARAAESSAAERLQELVDQSTSASLSGRSNEFPLVTNVCNALAEFTEDGVVFVSVYDPKYSTTEVFTYTDLMLDTSVFTSPNMHTSSVPLSQASAYMLKTYNKYRCYVQRVDVGVDTSGKYSENSGTMFLAYDVQIIY